MFKKIKQKRRHKQLKNAGIVVNSKLSGEIQFFGDRTGMWPLYSAFPNKGGLIYSFGVGNNLSWELELLENYPAQIFTYDPTPASIDWVASQLLPEGLNFSPIGLADFCGDVNFFIPRREGRFNYSVVKRGGKYPNQTIACQVQDLATVAKFNKHTKINVLKLDIEGAEMTALPNALNAGIEIEQILVELHYNYAGVTFSKTVELINSLFDHGYDLFWISSRAYEFGFVKPAQT
ncbi:MAG: FkbM family methyltransferase [Saprospiraceae bacterium]|jgi:FkbM family methyltransferase